MGMLVRASKAVQAEIDRIRFIIVAIPEGVTRRLILLRRRQFHWRWGETIAVVTDELHTGSSLARNNLPFYIFLT